MLDMQQAALDAFEKWYQSLEYVPQNDGPAKGTVASALVLLERLRNDYTLDIEQHVSDAGTQVKGAGGSAVKNILARFGEVRNYTSEGGRTNRGARRAMELLLATLETLKLDSLSDQERQEILGEMQQFLVDRIRDYFGRQRLSIAYDPTRSTWQFFYELLQHAKIQHKDGAVAQYLVGAKLDLRFPDVGVENQSSTTADDQTERSGDFTIEDTVFHVTVAPMSPLFDKCKRNLDNGYRAYVLTPHDKVEGARQQAEQVAPGQITVAAIESFVAQNIEEISTFSNYKLSTGLHALLAKYNERTELVEVDKSVLIEIPHNLEGWG